MLSAFYRLTVLDAYTLRDLAIRQQEHQTLREAGGKRSA